MGFWCFGFWGAAAGTDSADEARDTDLDLKKRFYLQPLPPTEAAERVKTAVKDIKDVKTLIDKKAWPYVQNGLRSSASYLRFDLSTITSSKPKGERKSFKELSNKAFAAMDSVSPPGLFRIFLLMTLLVISNLH